MLVKSPDRGYVQTKISVYTHQERGGSSVSKQSESPENEKGLSQGELAIRLNVVRQTVSKWEKGVSVPDAETLIKLADLLDTSVNDLLGSNVVPEDSNDMNKIADQLVRVNEQLAIKNNRARRIWKVVVITIAVFVFLVFVIAMLNYMPPQ